MNLKVIQCNAQPFQISKSLITNGEYLEFIESGGYQESKYWLDEGWAWVQDNNVSKPLYWKTPK